MLSRHNKCISRLSNSFVQEVAEISEDELNRERENGSQAGLEEEIHTWCISSTA